MKRLRIVLLIVAAVFSAAADDRFQLSTRSLSLVIEKVEGRWELVHFGSRISTADAMALKWSWPSPPNDNGQRRPATYSVLGSPGRRTRGRVNKFGGLAVTHADGTLSTDLLATEAREVQDADGAQHLLLVMKDATSDFRVLQHFRALGSSDVFETWVEIENDEGADVRLVRMDSAALVFPLLAEEFHLLSLSGQWAGESVLNEAEVARGQTSVLTSRSGVRNAMAANPAFMLSVGERATETTGRVIGGALCWSGSWMISVEHDNNHLVEIDAGADTSAGAYVLAKGARIVLPKFAFTYSDRGKGQISRNFHRWARDWQLPNGHKPRPILMNSWEGVRFAISEPKLCEIMDGAKCVGCELFVLDDGWFGVGEFARDDRNRDSAGLGDWEVNPAQLPNGLSHLGDEAAKRGLSFGLWVEPEMANTRSRLATEHPGWILRERRRPLYEDRGDTQVVLDYANPSVRDGIFAQLDSVFSAIGTLSYVKWDANADMMNIGSEYLARDRQANLLFDHTVGVYDFLACLRVRYPKLDIQACASGGGRMDYGFLRYADEFWPSDDSDARERIFIQWGASHFYPACAIGAHVTSCPNRQTGRILPLKFRFAVAMSGRLGFELQPSTLTAGEMAFCRAAVADYKRLRETIQQGDLYRLISPYGGKRAALMYANGDKSKAVLFHWGLLHCRFTDIPTHVVLDGLDPSRRYLIREILKDGGRCHTAIDGKTIGGDALMSIGISIEQRGDWDVAVLELTAE